MNDEEKDDGSDSLSDLSINERSSPEDVRKQCPAAKFLGGRWVTHDPGDSAKPNIRCDDVATDVNHHNVLLLCEHPGDGSHPAPRLPNGQAAP